MRYLLHTLFSLTLLFTSCSNDVAGTSDIFTNPLDPVTAEEQGFITTAIVFFPSEVAVNAVYDVVTLDVHAMEVPNLGGAHIQVSYNKQKLALQNLSLGRIIPFIIKKDFQGQITLRFTISVYRIYMCNLILFLKLYSI